MAINKVVYGNNTLIDLTEDTVSADKLLAGETAHDRSGAPVVGSVVTAEVVDNLTTQDATKALSAKQGYVLNQNKVDKVTGKGLSTNDYTNEDKAKVTSSDSKITNYEDRGYLGKNKFINSLPIGYTKTINGITFTVNDDHSITVNGTATAQANAYIFGVEDISDSSLKPYHNGVKQTDILSGCPSNGSENTYVLVAGSLSARYGTDTGSGAELTNFSSDGIRVIIRIASGVTVNNLVFKPMIREASSNATYQPYVKSNIELDSAKIDKTASEIQTSDGQFSTVTGGLMQKCLIDLEPIQDLHGYSKPWTGGSGKNKLPITVDAVIALNGGASSWSNNSKVINGVTFKLNTDNDGNLVSISTSGTASGNANLDLVRNFTVGASFLSGTPSGSTGSNYYIRCGIDGTYYTDSGNGIAINGTITSVWIGVANGMTAPSNPWLPMIESGSTKTSFEPYSNICSISGHSQIEVENRGKNKLPYPYLFSSMTRTGMTITAQSDGKIAVTGTNTSSAIERIDVQYFTLDVGSYIISGLFPKTGCYATLRDGDTGSFIANIETNSYALNVSSKKKYLIAINITSGNTTGVTYEPMIRKATDSAEFEPYNGYTVTIDLGGTYYGGKLDAVSGVLTVTDAFVEITASNGEYASYLNRYLIRTNVLNLPTAKSSYDECICDEFEAKPLPQIEGGAVAVYAHNDIIAICNYKTSLANYQSFLTNNPVHVAYKVATPFTIQLTPKTLETLVGQNDVFAPLVGQSVEEVEYREVLAWDDVEAYADTKADISAIAPVENGTTASQYYRKGKHFYRNGKFCTAKVNIWQGEVFTLNTNYVEGDVASAFDSLSSVDSLTHLTPIENADISFFKNNQVVTFLVETMTITNSTTLAKTFSVPQCVPSGYRPPQDFYFDLILRNSSSGTLEPFRASIGSNDSAGYFSIYNIPANSTYTLEGFWTYVTTE